MLNNKNVKTKVIEDEQGWYGLIAYCNGSEYKKYCSLTRDESKINKLSQNVNRGGVSLLHIDDIVEDFLD